MYSEVFLRDRKHPNHWYNRSLDLKASAGVLYYGMNQVDGSINESLGYPSGYSMSAACRHPYYLMCGLSVEAILKFRLSKVSDESSIPATHDLLNLVGMLNIELSKEDRKKIDYLSMCISWAGRYPYPKQNNAEQWKKHADLYDAIFLKRATGFGLAEQFVIKTGNNLGALEWEDFSRLWGEVANS